MKAAFYIRNILLAYRFLLLIKYEQLYGVKIQTLSQYFIFYGA